MFILTFFKGAEGEDHATTSYARMTQLFDDLGLQMSPEKDVPPTHEMTCFGVSVNTLDMTLTFSEFHFQGLHDDLSSWLNKAHFSQRDPQQRLGKLGSVTACVRPGVNLIKLLHL